MKNRQKHTKNINNEKITDVAFLKSDKNDFSCSLFCKEQRERFAHSRSFVKSYESDLLTIALFKERQG